MFVGRMGFQLTRAVGDASEELVGYEDFLDNLYPTSDELGLLAMVTPLYSTADRVMINLGVSLSALWFSDYPTGVFEDEIRKHLKEIEVG